MSLITISCSTRAAYCRLRSQNFYVFIKPLPKYVWMSPILIHSQWFKSIRVGVILRWEFSSFSLGFKWFPPTLRLLLIWELNTLKFMIFIGSVVEKFAEPSFPLNWVDKLAENLTPWSTVLRSALKSRSTAYLTCINPREKPIRLVFILNAAEGCESYVKATERRK